MEEWKSISAATAVFVAVVTSGGAIGIAAHAAMVAVSLTFPVGGFRVAIDASETGKVGRNLVAVVTDGAMVGDREVIAVIEGRAEPTGSRVAAGGIARCGEARGDVVWNGTTERLRGIPIRDVAGIARGVGGSERVVVADVAETARSGQVRAG